MHFFFSYIGILKKVTDKFGCPCMDWKQDYVGMKGLITVFQSDTDSGIYMIYFFPECPSESFFCTSEGKLRLEMEELRMETEHSVYVFELNLLCIRSKKLLELTEKSLALFTNQYRDYQHGIADTPLL